MRISENILLISGRRQNHHLHVVKILVNFFYLLQEIIADRMSACYVSFFAETQLLNICAGVCILGWRTMDTLGCRCDWRPSDTNHIKGDDFRHTPPSPRMTALQRPVLQCKTNVDQVHVERTTSV